MVESECTKLKKELQEQHKDIQYLTLESNRSHETARIATREVEAVKQELIEERKNVERIKENFIRDITFSDSKAIVAEAKLSDLQRKTKLRDYKACTICLTNEKDMAFGCGHMTCRDCGSKLSKCPICREQITSHIKLFSLIGPALGGYLAQPAVKYPHLFPKDSFWDKFPYFLPSLSVSAFAFVVAIACIWLPETLHNHPLSNESIDDAEALETGNISNDDDKIIQKDENLFLNWPLMSSIIVYSIFSLYNVAYQEVFSLWAVSPGRFGGLNFTTDNVGDVLAISGIGLIVSQLFLYPSLERAFGPIKFARISAVLSIPLLQSYPFIAMLSGITLYLVINIASLLKNVLSMTIITGLFIMQNRAVEQHQRGAANGIAMTIMSIFKAIGPAGGGAV
ncbi:probable peptide/nitrate transporter At3g43790 [Lathyrus oleraceus]|uniref:probable peptide/nitrate transporter At3g43790 n=1 Tax=Pisum sativum TaxID=3888 RepID=UPI0021D0EBC6|nr:probable peptide/nitrate transporter At3g43790 [Pisum sativum]